MDDREQPQNKEINLDEMRPPGRESAFNETSKVDIGLLESLAVQTNPRYRGRGSKALSSFIQTSTHSSTSLLIPPVIPSHPPH